MSQIGDNSPVRISGFGNLTGMNHEARLGYLCSQAAQNQLTLDEMSELLGYVALDPSILDLIHIEILLRERYRV